MKTRLEIPRARKCADWDCNRAARRNGLFCSDACRARTWRRNNPDYTPPPGESARQNGAERRKGGLQVSFLKALDAMVSDCLVNPVVAERALVARLSPAQRERWEARR